MIWVLILLSISFAAATVQTATGQVGGWLGWWPTPYWPKELVSAWFGMTVGYGALVAWLWWINRRDGATDAD